MKYFKKIILLLILIFGFYQNTFADTVLENSGNYRYDYKYYNYSDKNTYYFAFNFIDISIYGNIINGNDGSIIQNTPIAGGGGFTFENSAIPFNIIENPKFSLLFYKSKDPYFYVIYIDKINNSFIKSKLLESRTNQILNFNLFINKDYIVLSELDLYDSLIFNINNGTFTTYSYHDYNIVENFIIDNNIANVPIRKYILSNDNKNYIFNNNLTDTLDYYNFDENNLKTDNQNFFILNGNNTDNLFNFQQQSLNNNYFNINNYLYQVLDNTQIDLGTNVLLGFSGSTLLSVPFSGTQGFSSYSINNDFGSYLAGLSYYNNDYIANYVSNNILYRYDNSITQINFTSLVNDTIDTGTGGLDTGTGGLDNFDQNLFTCDTNNDGECGLLNGEIFVAIINFFKYIWNSLMNILSNIADFFKLADNIFTTDVKTFGLNVIGIKYSYALDSSFTNESLNIANAFNNNLQSNDDYKSTTLGKLDTFFKAFIGLILSILAIMGFIALNSKKND